MPQDKLLKVSSERAYGAYLEKYPNTTVIEVELKKKGSSYIYKIKGFDEEKEYKVYVNAENGKVIEVAEKLSKGMVMKISKSHTKDIESLVNQAMDDAGVDSSLLEWSLEVDEGILELTVEIGLDNDKELKYKYNLASKELIKKK